MMSYVGWLNFRTKIILYLIFYGSIPMSRLNTIYLLKEEDHHFNQADNLYELTLIFDIDIRVRNFDLAQLKGYFFIILHKINLNFIVFKLEYAAI